MKAFARLEASLQEGLGVLGSQGRGDSSLYAKLTEGREAVQNVAGTRPTPGEFWPDQGGECVTLPGNDVYPAVAG